MLRKLLSSTPISQDLGLLVLRVAAGGLLVRQAWGVIRSYDGLPSDYKTFGSDTAAFASGLVVFFGGLMIAAGLLTRAGALFLTILLGLAVYRDKEVFARSATTDALFFVIAICIFLAGPGRFSIDALRGGAGGSGGAPKAPGKSKN